MKIKEVESLLDMNQKNLRFYEEQGLIKPKRLKNGYRDYSSLDVQHLKEIKLLRMMGVSIEKIRLLQEGKLELNQLLDEQMEQLEQEIKSVKRMKTLCQEVRKSEEPLSRGDQFLNQLNEVEGMKDWKRQDVKKGALYLILGLIWPDLLNAQLADDLSKKN